MREEYTALSLLAQEDTMHRTLLCIFWILALSGVTRADASDCSNQMWSSLSSAQLYEKGLIPLVATLTSEVDRARKHQNVSAEVSIEITDCLIQGYSLRTIKFPKSLLFFTRNFNAEKRGYGIFLTSGYAQRDVADLRYRIQKEVCLIAHGLADFTERTHSEERSPPIKYCMYEVALNAGDFSYASWIRRTLPPIHGSREARIAEIQKRIDFLYRLPTIPIQAIQRLESARKALTKSTP